MDIFESVRWFSDISDLESIHSIKDDLEREDLELLVVAFSR